MCWPAFWMMSIPSLTLPGRFWEQQATAPTSWKPSNHSPNLIAVDALKAKSNEVYKKAYHSQFVKCNAHWNKYGRSTLIHRLLRIIKDKWAGAVRVLCSNLHLSLVHFSSLFDQFVGESDKMLIWCYQSSVDFTFITRLIQLNSHSLQHAASMSPLPRKSTSCEQKQAPWCCGSFQESASNLTKSSFHWGTASLTWMIRSW